MDSNKIRAAFSDRHRQLADMEASETIDTVKNKVLMYERRNELLLNRKFQNNRNRILSLVCFRNFCANTPERTCRVWLSNNCAELLPREISSIAEHAKFSWKIFTSWDIIAENLSILQIDHRDLSLRKLYNAVKLAWCVREFKQSNKTLPPPPSTPIVPVFNEHKLQRIIAEIRRTCILDDVQFDQEQAKLISDRIVGEINRMCIR